jgi:hypothetical protein
MVRNIHDEDVADTAGGAKPGLALRDCPEELIGMEASFHQQLGFACANNLDRLLCCRLTVRNIDDVEALNVETVCFGHAADALLGSDQNRINYSGLCRL